MNWVGGARKRIRGSARSDKKIQKEFFERKRLSAVSVAPKEQSSKRAPPTCRKHGLKVSQDLLAFQMTRKAGQSRGSGEKPKFRVLDLGSKRAAPGMTLVGGKCIQNVELPISPLETPSVLNLSVSPPSSCTSESNRTNPKYKTTFEKRGRDNSHENALQYQSTKYREMPKTNTAFPMDLFGGKVHVPKPSRERQTQGEKSSSNQSESRGHQFGMTGRQAERQPPLSSRYDTDSDISSLFSSFSEQRIPRADKINLFTAEPKPLRANWWSQKDEQSFVPLLEGHFDYFNTSGDNHKALPYPAAQDGFKHRNLQSPTRPFNVHGHVNMQLYKSSNCSELPSPPSDISSIFTNNTSSDQYVNSKKTVFEHGLFPCRDSSLRGQIYSSAKEDVPQALALRDHFNPPIKNSFVEYSKRCDEYNALHSTSARYGDYEISTASSHFNTWNHKLDKKSKAILPSNKEAACHDSGNKIYHNSVNESRDRRWVKEGDYHRDKKGIYHTPTARMDRSSHTTSLGVVDAGTSKSPGESISGIKNPIFRKSPPTNAKSKLSVSRKQSASSTHGVFLEICSLEDQVSQETAHAPLKKGAEGTNVGSQGIHWMESQVDPDVQRLVSQMLDFILMDQNIYNALKCTKTKTYSGTARYPHSNPSFLHSHNNAFSGSTLFPLKIQQERLYSDLPVGQSKEVQVGSPKRNHSVAIQTSPVALVDAASSPCGQLCSQPRYNTRRHSHRFGKTYSPRQLHQQRKSKKYSRKRSGMKQQAKNIENTEESEKLLLTQPED